MVEILTESDKFNTRSKKKQTKKLANQVRSTLKKGWLPGFEILGIHKQVSREECAQEDPSSQAETQNIT